MNVNVLPQMSSSSLRASQNLSPRNFSAHASQNSWGFASSQTRFQVLEVGLKPTPLGKFISFCSISLENTSLSENPLLKKIEQYLLRPTTSNEEASRIINSIVKPNISFYDNYCTKVNLLAAGLCFFVGAATIALAFSPLVMTPFVTDVAVNFSFITVISCIMYAFKTAPLTLHDIFLDFSVEMTLGVVIVGLSNIPAALLFYPICGIYIVAKAQDSNADFEYFQQEINNIHNHILIPLDSRDLYNGFVYFHNFSRKEKIKLTKQMHALGQAIRLTELA